MKRFTVFLVLALTLVTMAALTSCGCGASVQGSGATDSTNSTTDSNGTNGGNASNGNTNNGNTSNGGNANTGNGSTSTPGNGSVMDDMIQGGEDIVGGVDDAIDDITGNGSHNGGVTYDDMLQDGNVNDSDGVLGNESAARSR